MQTHHRLKQIVFSLILLLCLAFPETGKATCIGLGCGCSVVVSDLAFGVYDPFSSSGVDSTATIEVTCGAIVLGATFGYEISLATGSSGSYAARSMSNGISNLSYNLYETAGHTVVWGDGAGGTSTISDGYLLSLLYNRTRDYTIYGRIPGSQSVSAGYYSDTIMVTVNY